MRTIIIYAHPHTPYSHNKIILDEVIKHLKRHNRKYKLLDLYAMKYDPVLHESELYTVPNSKPSRQTKQLQKLIGEAQDLIFIHPVWWNSMPAILKGFVDKIFTSGFAFKYDHHGIPHKLLKGKKAAVFMTTTSPKWMHYLVQGTRALQLLAVDVLFFAGIRARVYYIGGCKRISDKKIEQIKRVVDRGMRYLY